MDLPFQFNITTPLEDQLVRLNERDRARLREPTNLGNFTLYYPISFYDELGLSPFQYAPNRAITPLELIQTIHQFYQTEVPRESLLAYVQRRPETYQRLLDSYSPYQKILLSDLVGGRLYIQGLEPYENGFIVSLRS